MIEIAMNDIFLIDNTTINEASNVAVLEGLGHRVTAFSDSRSALEALEKVNQPDVIFISIDMPKIHGIEFFDVVARMCPGVPIVVTSLTTHPHSDILRRTAHLRYRLFGRLRKQGVEFILQSAIK